MIVINKPVLQTEGDFVIISSEISIGNKIEILWYKFPNRFEEYVVYERLDAFIVGLLFLGLKTGEDFYLKGPVSHRLFYTLNLYLIDVLCAANTAYKKIKVFAENLDSSNLNLKNIAGTGLSCGVDSFATYYDHLKDEGNYKIECFTFFDVGSHGVFEGKKAGEVYKDRLQNSREFAKNEGKELISVESNLSKFLELPFQSTNTLRNISCVLHFQKLFSNYYFASSYPYKHFKLDPTDTTYYDIWNLHLLSTESTNFYSSVPGLTRIEKTALISNYEGTFNFLDVCLTPDRNQNFKNCTQCEKCLRTCLTLELLGKLENYHTVFDLKAYKEQKNRYIGQILNTRKKNIFSEEIFQLLKEKRVLSKTHYFEKVKNSIDIRWRGFKKRIKQQLK